MARRSRSPSLYHAVCATCNYGWAGDARTRVAALNHARRHHHDVKLEVTHYIRYDETASGRQLPLNGKEKP